MLAVVWLAAGCGSADKAASPTRAKSPRALEPKYAETASTFSRHRDGYEVPPAFVVRASDDNPAQLKDDPVMTLFVGDAGT